MWYLDEDVHNIPQDIEQPFSVKKVTLDIALQNRTKRTLSLASILLTWPSSDH